MKIDKFPYIVDKPWGREEWLELIDLEGGKGYCLKKVIVNKGKRLSFQYHHKKIETNYLVSGIAEVYIENSSGELERHVKKAGDSWTLNRLQKHHMKALTDLFILECSTPEVDDVVRIEDDTGRGNGRIDSEHNYKKEN